MRARRVRALTRWRLRGAPRKKLEELLSVAEEGLRTIDALIEAGADTPSNVTERCVWEHNRRLLQAQLSSIRA